MEKFRDYKFERWEEGAEVHKERKMGKPFWENNSDNLKKILEDKNESPDKKAEKIAFLKLDRLLNLIQSRPPGEKFYSHITDYYTWRSNISKEGLVSKSFSEKIKREEFIKQWDKISKNDLIYLANDNEATWTNYVENPVFIIVDPDIELCPPGFGELDTTARHRIAPRDILAVMIEKGFIDNLRKEKKGKVDRKSNIWKYIENNKVQYNKNMYSKPEYAVPIIAGEVKMKHIRKQGEPILDFKYLLWPEYRKLTSKYKNSPK